MNLTGWLEAIGEFYATWWGLISLAIVALSFYLQHHYQVVNRIGKIWAKLLNSETKVSLFLEFHPGLPFPQVKNAIKNAFRGETIAITRDTDIRIDLHAGIFAVALVESPDSTVVLEVQPTACGIRDLKHRLDALLTLVGKFTETTSRGQILGGLRSCEMRFQLPYKWEHLVISTPKKLDIQEYTISMSHDNNSSVEVSRGNLRVMATRTDALLPVLDSIL